MFIITYHTQTLKLNLGHPRHWLRMGPRPNPDTKTNLGHPLTIFTLSLQAGQSCLYLWSGSTKWKMSFNGPPLKSWKLFGLSLYSSRFRLIWPLETKLWQSLSRVTVFAILEVVHWATFFISSSHFRVTGNFVKIVRGCPRWVFISGLGQGPFSRLSVGCPRSSFGILVRFQRVPKVSFHI